MHPIPPPSPFALFAPSLALLLASACGAAHPPLRGADDPLVITTTGGPVRGLDEAGLRVFRGIPYAAPPVGRLRFQPPAAVEPWTEPRDASGAGPACPQLGLLTREALAWSEDCLTVNVWAHRGGEPRPVMVFIHGGGFVDGAGSLPLYDGATLALAGDVVVVTMNYRLGPLGFLATPALAADAGGVAGNLGILDQAAALAWVRDNAAAFGGDPSRILLFGESAGATSVCAHLAAPGSEGLFQRAILQSSSGCAGALTPAQPRPETGASAFDLGAALVARTPCAGAADQVACLRALPAQALLDAFAQEVAAGGFAALTGFQPLVDGVVLPAEPRASVARGATADVPVLIGSNADEWTLFVLGGADPAFANDAEYEPRLAARFGPLAPALLALYPAASFGSGQLAYERLMRDLVFVCPTQSFAELAGGGAAPAYAYHFTHALGGGAGPRLGATHMLELGFVFGHIEALPFGAGFEITEVERALTRRIQETWSWFAHDGVPSVEPGWPATTAASPRTRLLGPSQETVAALSGDRCPDLRALGLVP